MEVPPDEVTVTTEVPTVEVLDRVDTVGVPLVIVVVLPKAAAVVVDVPAAGVGDELQEVEVEPLVHVVDTVGAPLSLFVTGLELTLLTVGPTMVCTGAPDKPLVVVTVLVSVVV